MIITTPGAPDANSYATVAEADAYNAVKPLSTWATLTPEAKEAALIHSAMLLDASFIWTGQATGAVAAVAVAKATGPEPRDIFMYAWRYTTTTTGTPGSGQVRFNSGHPYTGVTFVEFHNITNGGIDIALALAALPIGSFIHIQDQDNSLRFGRFQVVSAIPTATTMGFNVNCVDTGETAIGNNQVCEVAFLTADEPGVGPEPPEPGVPNPNQVMCWPRVGMFTRIGLPIDSMELPKELKAAQSEYARQAAITDLTADDEAAKAGLSSVKAGSVSVGFQSKTSADKVALAGPGYSYLSNAVPSAVRLILVPSWYQQQPFLDALGQLSRDFMFQADR